MFWMNWSPFSFRHRIHLTCCFIHVIFRALCHNARPTVVRRYIHGVHNFFANVVVNIEEVLWMCDDPANLGIHLLVLVLMDLFDYTDTRSLLVWQTGIYREMITFFRDCYWVTVCGCFVVPDSRCGTGTVWYLHNKEKNRIEERSNGWKI